MAFLDNSGDIIIDAVLTDTGRYRLAKADGKFSVAKFALGDDEIDYGLYDSAATGSKDIQILQTPVLEAFTNNASSMKSKLISIPRNNILYLATIAENNDVDQTRNTDTNSYIVSADQTTAGNTTAGGSFMNGVVAKSGKTIRLDQGIDSAAINPSYDIDEDRLETEYIIEMDNRLGSLVSTAGDLIQRSYLDDDNIASYRVSLSNNPELVSRNESREVTGDNQVIQGPRGTTLTFGIRASIELNSSTHLFTTIGTEGADMTSAGVTGTVKYIDSNIRIQGATTGVTIDLPVRYIKSE